MGIYNSLILGGNGLGIPEKENSFDYNQRGTYKKFNPGEGLLLSFNTSAYGGNVCMQFGYTYTNGVVSVRTFNFVNNTWHNWVRIN